MHRKAWAQKIYPAIHWFFAPLPIWNFLCLLVISNLLVIFYTATYEFCEFGILC